MLREDTREIKNDSDNACLSPEKEVPWILDGKCMEHPTQNSSFVSSSRSSTNNQRTCSFCGESGVYLRELRDQLSVNEEMCKGMVVYGAALGSKVDA